MLLLVSAATEYAASCGLALPLPLRKVDQFMIHCPAAASTPPDSAEATGETPVSTRVSTEDEGGEILVTNPLVTNPPVFPTGPLNVGCAACAIGKSGDDVWPTTTMPLSGDTTSPLAASPTLPPRYVEKTSAEPRSEE